MRETEQVAGSIAGVAMLIIAASTVPFLYKRYYEGEFHLTICLVILTLMISSILPHPPSDVHLNHHHYRSS